MKNRNPYLPYSLLEKSRESKPKPLDQQKMTLLLSQTTRLTDIFKEQTFLSGVESKPDFLAVLAI